nr:hypothetical protein [Microbacterium excoecariae]
MAAYQLQRYTKDSYFSWYPVGRSSQVLWHPNSSCGSAAVTIKNDATAALYYYTPYQPNRAALNAGYGVGDSCSSYGNRNFYNYYTDWFGPTHGGGLPFVVDGAIASKWRALGGQDGAFGLPTGSEVCGLVDGGCYQRFEGGAIYTSAVGGTRAVLNSMLAAWSRAGKEQGEMGYPLSDRSCGLSGDGCYQRFESGAVYWSSGNGAHAVTSRILAGWSAVNKENGALLYPTTDMVCGLADDGCYQAFQRGAVFWSDATGAAAITNRMTPAWREVGKESGDLGYPTSRMMCGLVDGGCYQLFQGGATFWSSATGAHAITDAMMPTWRVNGKETGKLGYPTESTRCALADDGCAQQFAGGQIYWSEATGSKPVWGSMMLRYDELGNEESWLGYPRTRERCEYADGGCRQFFENGWIHWTPGKGTRVGT